MNQKVRAELNTLQRVWPGNWRTWTEGAHLSARLNIGALRLWLHVRSVEYDACDEQYVGAHSGWRVTLNDSDYFCSLAETEDLAAALEEARAELRRRLTSAFWDAGVLSDADGGAGLDAPG